MAGEWRTRTGPDRAHRSGPLCIRALKLLLLALLLAGCAPRSTRGTSGPDPVDALATVLRDVRARLAGRWEPLRIMVGEIMVWESPYEQPPGTHPLETLTRLRDLGLVQEICREPYCPRSPEPVRVRLGRVTALPPGTRVRILGEHPGVPLNEALQAIPDSLAVPADVRVDVTVGTPCPEPPDSPRCRYPDVVSWRYFLRPEPDGRYVVLTRWMIGAI